MNRSRVFYGLMVITLLFQNTLFAGGAEGHGGGESTGIETQSLMRLARKRHSFLVRHPEEFPWSKVSPNSWEVFLRYQKQMDVSLSQLSFVLPSNENPPSEAECLILMNAMTSEILISPDKCHSIVHSQADAVRLIMESVLRRHGLNEEDVVRLSVDLEELCRLEPGYLVHWPS